MPGLRMGGVRGKPRKAEALKVLQGTSRADRRRSGSTMLTEMVSANSQPPELGELDETGRKIYADVMRQLATIGILQTVDMPTIVAYCQQYSLYFRMQKEVDKRPFTINNKGDEVINPAYRIASKALELAVRMGTQYGLTVASRERLNPPKLETKEKGEFDDI